MIKKKEVLAIPASIPHSEILGNGDETITATNFSDGLDFVSTSPKSVGIGIPRKSTRRKRINAKKRLSKFAQYFLTSLVLLFTVMHHFNIKSHSMMSNTKVTVRLFRSKKFVHA